jgi:hypothetical protein
MDPDLAAALRATLVSLARAHRTITYRELDRIMIDRTHIVGSIDHVNPVHIDKVEQIHAVDGIASGDPNQPRSALAARVPVPPPHGIHKLTLALEALMREDHLAGRPLLAALAVSQTAPGIPGRGFFHLLAELGRYAGPDRGQTAAAAHAAELAQSFAFWGADPEAAPEGAPRLRPA